MVEAKKSVPYIWAPIRADGASGATGYYKGLLDLKVASFVLWERESKHRKEGISQG